MTTFLASGCDEVKIEGAEYLKSSKMIKVLTDKLFFFIAFTDCDIYASTVYYDKSESEYVSCAGLLSRACKKPSEAKGVYDVWSGIKAIIFLKGYFYFVTETHFYIYGTGDYHFK